MSYSKIREIQLEQLKMLKVLIDLFEKENIKYFAIGGTALGAIRHQGFIPWDDDIDIAVLESDYNKIFKLVNKLPPNFKLLSYELDNKFPLTFQKIYNMDVDYYCHSNRKYNVPRKIFIDIFPWYNIVYSKKLEGKIKNINKKFKRLVYKQTGSILDKAKYYLYKVLYFFRTSDYYFNLIYELFNRSLVSRSNTWGNILYNDWLDHEDIFPLRKIKFEDINIYIPNKCECYLEKKYGDYMTLPAKEDRVNHSRINLH